MISDVCIASIKFSQSNCRLKTVFICGTCVFLTNVSFPVYFSAKSTFYLYDKRKIGTVNQKYD